LLDQLVQHLALESQSACGRSERWKKMKEALVSPDLAVQVFDSPIPAPGQGEVLIKVKCAGCNPKDWKYPMHSGVTANSGDDLAGEICSVGDGVFEFRPGDRVAAMHEMRTSGGSFAEYAIAPAVTTFHLPQHVTFEEVQSSFVTCREDTYERAKT
jgi:NADPH:quinone reductase-like Zn-dependent oxidoreductase